MITPKSLFQGPLQELGRSGPFSRLPYRRRHDRRKPSRSTLVQSSLWTDWEFSVFNLRKHRGVGSSEDLGLAHGLPLAMLVQMINVICTEKATERATQRTCQVTCNCTGNMSDMYCCAHHCLKTWFHQKEKCPTFLVDKGPVHLLQVRH